MKKVEIERQELTMKFLEKHCPPPVKLLDLGTENAVSKLMTSKGYSVTNTQGQDLDLEPKIVSDANVELVTAIEILEHLVAPFNVLSGINAEKIIATVPLRLWFSKAYKNPKDLWDRHYHEFEDWQFDWLLEKAGWVIKDSEKWISRTKINGIRPLLRNFTPRYYAVYAERK